MLEFKRNAFLDAEKEAKKSKIKAYVYGHHDDAVLDRFNHILKTHKIKIYELAKDLKVDGSAYSAKANNYIVPLAQAQYKMVKTAFEKVNSFPDSLFYDVSTWTLPLAFDIDYHELRGKYNSSLLGKEWSTLSRKAEKKNEISEEAYAFAIPWNKFSSPKALFYLLKKNLVVKVSNEAFTMDNKQYSRGTIIIPFQQNKDKHFKIFKVLNWIQENCDLRIEYLSGGLSDDGITLGSPKQAALDIPITAMFVGDGINSYDAGELWFTMDKHYEMPLSKLDITRFRNTDLNRYNTLILPDGNYRALSDASVDKIKDWVKGGGNIIAFKRALTWLDRRDIIKLNPQKEPNKPSNKKSGSYENSSANSGAKVIGGAIFENKLDLSHPLCYGFDDDQLHVFKRGTQFYASTDNEYATPVKYTAAPLVSGYMHRSWNNKSKNASGVMVYGLGRGKIILFVDNPLFRGYWWGGFKLFANALFFGDIIQSNTVQR